MDTTFATVADLDQATQDELTRIQAIPEERRTARETAFMEARAVYVTNKIRSRARDGSILEAEGTELPQGAIGFANMAVFILEDGEGNQTEYINQGTINESDFQQRVSSPTEVPLYNIISAATAQMNDQILQEIEVEGLLTTDIVVASVSRDEDEVGARLLRATPRLGLIEVLFDTEPGDHMYVSYMIIRPN